jgi:uncharacterized surface protein with fasciclin (FAS1) repeats
MQTKISLGAIYLPGRYVSLIKRFNPGEIMKSKIAVLFLTVVAFAVTAAFASSKNPVVGEEMYPTKDIIDNAMNSADHTTLVAAVKAAGLVDTLKGSGPFTVFAPTNEAFAKLLAASWKIC